MSVESTRRSTVSRAIAIAKLAFTPIALMCLAWFAWLSRGVLEDIVSSANLPRLAAATLVWVAIQPLVPTLTTIILRAYGSTVRWRWTLKSHLQRLPARYVPGGIWHTVGRVADLHGAGIGGRALAALVMLENGLAVCVTFAAGGVILLAFDRPSPWPLVAGAGIAVGLAGLALLPSIANRQVRGAGTALMFASYSRSVATVVLFWLGASASFVLYLSAFPGAVAAGGAIEAAGVYLFAWALGFLAVFAPQGVGVFELVAGDLLNAPTGLLGTAVLVAGFRGVVLCADIVLWLIGRHALASTQPR